MSLAVFVTSVGTVTVPLCCRPFFSLCLGKGTSEELLVQEDIPNQPKCKLVQDVSTRWNSTYYMFEQLVEQEKTVVSYNHDNGISQAQ